MRAPASWLCGGREADTHEAPLALEAEPLDAASGLARAATGELHSERTAGPSEEGLRSHALALAAVEPAARGAEQPVARLRVALSRGAGVGVPAGVGQSGSTTAGNDCKITFVAVNTQGSTLRSIVPPR